MDWRGLVAGELRLTFDILFGLLDVYKRQGFATLPTCVNYFLARTDNDEKLIRFLLERALVVRHTRNFPGLEGKFVRVAARTREEDDLLTDALRDYLSLIHI